ncbi:MAG TPA: hypothetical protein VND93_14410 [Myxococcales bacterium]|nr:hypothetical protein [Myxococcales bacterium]
MAARARGVAQLRTLAMVRGSGVHSNERHVHQFQIASLELEKSRRSRERQAAMTRIKNIDARLQEIEAFIHKHQEALGTGAGGPPVAEPTPAPAEKRRTIRY